MRTNRWINAGLAIVPVVIVAVLGWHRRWVTDDAFINFRIIDNLLAGNGLVFNVGERVEAGTSFLWLLILAATQLSPNPLGLEMSAVVVGLTLSISAIAIAQLGAAKSRPVWDRAIALPVGALLFVCIMPVWDFATSGLETGLSFFWLAATWTSIVYAVRKPKSFRRIIFAGVLISLATTVRPDFGLYGAVFTILLLAVIRPRGRRLMAVIASLLIVPTAVEVFRAGYFATLVPNTALAKSASEVRLDFGLYYLNDFVSPYVLWLPFAVLIGLVALRRRQGSPSPERRMLFVQLAPVLAGTLHATYLIAIGGDYMHGRMMLPDLLAMLLPVMSITVKGRSLVVAIALVAWSAAIAFFFRPSYEILDRHEFVSNERMTWIKNIERNGGGSQNPIHLSDYSVLTDESLPLNQPSSLGNVYTRAGETRVEYVALANLSDRTIYAVRTLGAVGFQADESVWVVDRMGLADPIGSRLPSQPGTRPGHVKYLSDAWLNGRFAANVKDPNEVAAREALACGELKALTDAVTQPLTLNRFLENIALSPSLTRLEIPKVPAEAKTKFCS